MTARSDISFPDYLKKIDPKIGEYINVVTDSNSLTENMLVELLERQTKATFFTKSFKNVSFTVNDILNTYGLKLKLDQHTESRSFEDKVFPFDTNRFSNIGFEDKLEELWETPTNEKYKTETISWIRKGSASVKECKSCEGEGNIKCPDCRGKGEYWIECGDCNGSGENQSQCPACMGKGRVIETQISVGGIKRAGPAGGFSKKDVQCKRCNASGVISSRCKGCKGKGEILIPCPKCNTKGFIRCEKCKGHKSLYYCKLIVSKKVNNSEFIISSPIASVKPPWFENAVDKHTYQYEFDIKGGLNIIGKYSNNNDVLFEKYLILIIPVHQVHVMINNRKHTLRLYGFDNKKQIVSFPLAFTSLRKIFLYFLLPLFIATLLFVYWLIGN